MDESVSHIANYYQDWHFWAFMSLKLGRSISSLPFKHGSRKGAFYTGIYLLQIVAPSFCSHLRHLELPSFKYVEYSNGASIMQFGQ